MLDNQQGAADAGATSVEYALIVVAVAGLIAAIVFLLGGTTLGLFESSCDEIITAGTSAASC